MDPDDRIYFGMLLREMDRVATRLERCTDCDDSRDAGFFGAAKNSLQIAGKLREVQVCVCINEHEMEYLFISNPRSRYFMLLPLDDGAGPSEAAAKYDKKNVVANLKSTGPVR